MMSVASLVLVHSRVMDDCQVWMNGGCRTLPWPKPPLVKKDALDEPLPQYYSFVETIHF